MSASLEALDKSTSACCARNTLEVSVRLIAVGGIPDLNGLWKAAAAGAGCILRACANHSERAPELWVAIATGKLHLAHCLEVELVSLFRTAPVDCLAKFSFAAIPLPLHYSRSTGLRELARRRASVPDLPWLKLRVAAACGGFAAITNLLSRHVVTEHATILARLVDAIVTKDAESASALAAQSNFAPLELKLSVIGSLSHDAAKVHRLRTSGFVVVDDGSVTDRFSHDADLAAVPDLLAMGVRPDRFLEAVRPFTRRRELTPDETEGVRALARTPIQLPAWSSNEVAAVFNEARGT